jgi:hypothetical protein
MKGKKHEKITKKWFENKTICYKHYNWQQAAQITNKW